MDKDHVLEMMQSYFRERQAPEKLEGFAAQSPRALLKESLDVVDFVMYLEEELGQEIDITSLGEAIVSKNFGALAEEVAHRFS